MEYGKIYEDFYSKYYNKTELFIKLFFIKRKSQKKTFGNSIYDVKNHLTDEYKKNHNLCNNEKLLKLHQIFCQRHSIFESDPIQEIFANDIKTGFEKINASELPTDFTFSKFIKIIAIIEIGKEIFRLLENNSELLDMFYKLNEFEDFEIREHRGLSIEHYPIYKKMQLKLFPEQNSKLIKSKTIEVTNFNNNHWNELTFNLFNYLIDNYQKKGKVKYVNVYKYLKNIKKNEYAFNFTQKLYKEFIVKNFTVKITTFNTANFEFEDIEKPILNGIEQDFRKEKPN